MAVIKKTLFAKNLDKFAVLVNDTQADSKYFKITELPNTFTGGKNAFLIAGSEQLVPDTRIQIELKDSAGNIIYHEPGEGLISASVNGESFVTEYFEGVSKVVAVYVYPDTAYGPCTLTILGELSEYEDGNGIVTPVPLDWENKYNVKWQKQIDVNPSLANTTKIRFYRRPTVSITELLEPIYRVESGSKVSSGISQSFADIKISNLETFAGDVKRVKVFRTSLGDISDFSLIQDILVESKELLTTFGLSGSVVGNTGTFTSETLKNYWNTGSLNVSLSNNRVESGIKMNGSGKLTYTSSLDIKSLNTYEINLDAFYSASTKSDLGIYLSYVSQSTTFTSSIGTLIGTQPTKNLLDTTIPFRVDRDYPSASLYFSQSQGEWHVGNISLRLSQDTAFSPDEVSFVTTMPTVIGNEDFNFKFEFYDVNNNYVPVAVTQSANFTGGNANQIFRSLTFDSDRNAFRFSTGSIGNPRFQTIGFTVGKVNLTGSVTYGRSVYDITGSYIDPIVYTSVGAIYPGEPTNPNENGFIAHIDEFTGSINTIMVGSITYTASCDGLHQHETVYRFEDGDNAPGVFVTANTNQFIYKATDLSLNPTGQIITIEAKRKNLASADTPLTINSGSGKPPLTYVSTNTTNGVDTYTISGTSYPYSTGETIYSISGSDQFDNVFSDAIKLSPVKILDGLSVSLTNDNASIPARSTGFIESGSFVLSSGSVSVKVGNEIIAHSNGLSANNRFDVVSAVASNVQTGSLNYSTTDYFITRLDADSGSLNLTIRYKDGAGDTSDTTKLVTYTKNKKAAPVLQISSTPKDQTVTAKSTGEQIDAFANVSVSVKQTYDGATTNLTITSLTATSANISSISTTPSTGLVTLNGKTLANGVNSTTVDISAVVTDSEGVSRTITDTLALSKTKKAVPNVVISATPQAQSVLANAAGVQTGTLSNVTVSALEGTTSRFTSMTGTYAGFSTNPTITGNQLNMTGSIMNDAEASATIVATHTDSEGTTGQTQTIIARFTKVNTGTKGDNGTNGDVGANGKRTATGLLYYRLAAATAPPTPSATSYTFSTNTFASLTTDWALGAPTFAAGNSNKYWYSTYTAVETNAGGDTAVPTFTTVTQAIGFTGLVTFTSTDKITDGTNTSNIVPSGSITNHIGGANVTTINGGKISTGVITSTGYTLPIGDTDASGTYTTAGTIFNLDNGSLRSKNFYISSAGAAFFRGDISAATGTFTGGVSGTGYTLNNSGLNLTNAGSVIELGNGVRLSSSGLSGTAFSLNTLGITANAGTIAGWVIDGNSLSKSNGTHTIKLSSADTSYYITRNGTEQVKVKISPATTIDAIAIASTDYVNFTYASTTRLTVTGTSYQEETRTLTATSGRGDTDAGFGSAGTGIIRLVNPNEEIWVDADAASGLSLLGFLATISVSGGTINYDDGVNAYYGLTLVAEKYATYTHALNRTNLIQTYRSTIVENTLVKIADSLFDFSDFSYGIYGGGFQVDSSNNWFFVYLEQTLRCSTFNGNPLDDSALVYMNDFGGTVKVSFGAVNNGYSQLAPAGIQIYTGVRNYMNASVSTISGENFFEVKGKSAFLSGLAVNGTLSAGTKQFQITHPLNENKWLYHTAIEGPQADLIYRGKLNLINGEGSSNIDVSSRLTNGTFNSLTRNPQLFLQNNDSFDRIKGKIENGNVYVISENQNSSASVDWTVIAERCDTEVLTGGTYGGDGKYKTEKWKREYRNSLMTTGSI
jgi:hypothetical protein